MNENEQRNVFTANHKNWRRKISTHANVLFIRKNRIREKRKIKNERTYMAFYNVINGGAADDFRM